MLRARLQSEKIWNQSSNQTSHQSARPLVRRLVSGPFGSDCKTVLHIPHTSLIHVAQTHKATISCSHNNLQRIWDVQQNLKLKSNRGTILNLPLSMKHCSSSSFPVATLQLNCPQDSAHVLPVPPTEQTVHHSPFPSPSHHSPSQLSHNRVDESKADTDAACSAEGP